MAAIVKANATLTAGGLSVVRRSFTTSDDGLMRYEVEYVCLSQYAAKWTPFFRTKAQPPTPLPSSVLQLQLTRTPELYDLQTETTNGLTYFRAVYSAGIATEVIITEESDVRNFSYSIVYPTGVSVTRPNYDPYSNATSVTSFVTTGQETITYNFDYVSVTVTASSKNADVPLVKGRVGPPFNSNGPGFPSGLREATIDKTSKTRTSRGEYSYTNSSTGIYTGPDIVKSTRPRPTTSRARAPRRSLIR